MIELQNDQLRISFPDVHHRARLSIEFQRTLRIPDDGKEYPLPPGLDRFPLRHVDDFARFVPPTWVKHGGVMFPMYQAEAMWVNFKSETKYPFAVRIATGKTCAVSGAGWSNGLEQNGTNDKQNYVVVPRQPWCSPPEGFSSPCHE